MMFEGSIVAIATPMEEDGRVDYQALSNLVDFHIDNGTNAIVAVGTTGESATLSVDEHNDVVHRIVEFAAGRIPIIAGTGANSTAEALHLTAAAKKAGADACLLVAPYYNKPNQEGLFQHYRSIAEQVDIPQILYNVPGRTACDIQPQTVDRLANFANIVAIKEANTLERINTLIETAGDRMAVFAGDDPVTLGTVKAGGKGVISVTANVAPRLVSELCRLGLAGDFAAAEKIDQQLKPLNAALFVESNPMPVKWALQELGLIKAGIRLPMVPLAAEHHDAVRAALRQANVL